MALRAFILWAGIIPLAIVNGIFRESILLPKLGPSRARMISGLVLAAGVFVYTLATIGWLPSAAGANYVYIGAFWLVCTVLFEVIFGRAVAKKTWVELGHAYTFKKGRALARRAAHGRSVTLSGSVAATPSGRPVNRNLLTGTLQSPANHANPPE